MKVLVTGGTGFVGQFLIRKLGDSVVTTRNVVRARECFDGRHCDAVEWNPTSEPLELGQHNQFSAVVNLMGESIAQKRWNEDQKNRIRSSRVDGTRRLVDAILKMKTRPKVLVSASAVGIYGDCGDEVITEEHSTANDFLADICKEWESATAPLVSKNIRVVIVRIGIVLGREGGALKKLIPLFNLGLGGKLGRGRHYVPWIHVEDLVGLIVWSIANESVSGPLNATAPNPVRNSEFTRVLGKALKRPSFLRVPSIALRLVAGEFANFLLASQRVIPEAALMAGFEFHYPKLDLAIQEIVES